MENFLKNMLYALRQVSGVERIALIQMMRRETGVLIAGLQPNGFKTYKQSIRLLDMPLEAYVEPETLFEHCETYPGKLGNGLPIPTYDDLGAEIDCLCLPLQNRKKRVNGVLLFALPKDEALSVATQQVLEALQNLLSISFELAAENSNLSKLAIVDTFTGLNTRSYFEKRLQEEFSRAERQCSVVSLLLVEIDRLKQIHDEFGYHEARHVLQIVAHLVNDSIRKEIDIPCRYTGSQIILLLPDTDPDGAVVVAERIRQKCENYLFKTQILQKTFKATVSIGISHNQAINGEHTVSVDGNDAKAFKELSKEELDKLIEENEVSKEEMIYRADLMLTAARQAGHNRVMVWW